MNSNSDNSVFNTFPQPPAENVVTLCEQNGQLMTSQTENMAGSKMQGYPVVVISHDHHKSLSGRENAKSAFLPHDETVWKRAMHAWYEMGLSGVFQEVVNSSGEVPPWTSDLAKKTLTLVRWTSSLHGSLFPHLSMSNEDMICKFSRIHDWKRSPVHAFSWHPHTVKFAYALQDDSINVHMGKSDLVPVLKHKLQKNVADLSWQPQSASVLAVACQSCVLIWHVEPTSLATRPSTSSVQVLQQNSHTPVTCLAWDPNGRILLSSSPVDTAIMAWDVAMETCTPLRRVGGGGVSLLKWSPDGSKVFSATPSHLFRVWETTKWSCEVWTKCTGRCKTACWSPDGRILLFATENEPIIYSLSFSTAQDEKKAVIGGSHSAIAAVDISEVTLQGADGKDFKTGGLVHSMVWDQTGERLAVLLQDNGGHIKRQIVLFRTKVDLVLEITPCGFVQGEPTAIPHHISFQPKYDNGAVLSVIWSTGNLTYIPLYFVPSRDVEFHQFQHTSTNMNGHILSPLQS
ncbi:aladin-like [Mytilus edulis]|uniref:aladin-like n=1 Tax=Mytilus edulis TaxID=6550 RepID=UPI0039F1199B